MKKYLYIALFLDYGNEWNPPSAYSRPIPITAEKISTAYELGHRLANKLPITHGFFVSGELYEFIFHLAPGNLEPEIDLKKVINSLPISTETPKSEPPPAIKPDPLLFLNNDEPIKEIPNQPPWKITE